VVDGCFEESGGTLSFTGKVTGADEDEEMLEGVEDRDVR
jgi:hypothetical protein